MAASARRVPVTPAHMRLAYPLPGPSLALAWPAGRLALAGPVGGAALVRSSALGPDWLAIGGSPPLDLHLPGYCARPDQAGKGVQLTRSGRDARPSFWRASMLISDGRRVRERWRMRHGSSGAAAVALSLTAALALGACNSGGDDRYAAEVVRPGEVVERVSAPGVVQAAGQADLKAPAAARVERLAVKDGQRVRRGQLVARLSSEQLDDQVKQAQAAADGAQADSLRRSIEAATAAQRGQAQLALELARDQQRRLVLRAPLAGTVQLGRTSTGAATVPSLPGLPEGAEQALQGLGGTGTQGQAGPPLRVGSEVAAGQTVATVFDTSDLLVAAEVDETDIALVRPGQPTRVELDAFPAATFDATVRRVAVAPVAGQSAAGGVTYQVDLVLGEAGGPGRPVPRVGMTATAAIEVRRAVGKLSVAGSALVGRAGGQAVFVVERGKVRLRQVQVAADGEDRVAIAAGLREGERVVSRGAERLRDGQDWPGA